MNSLLPQAKMQKLKRLITELQTLPVSTELAAMYVCDSAIRRSTDRVHNKMFSQHYRKQALVCRSQAPRVGMSCLFHTLFDLSKSDEDFRINEMYVKMENNIAHGLPGTAIHAVEENLAQFVDSEEATVPVTTDNVLKRIVNKLMSGLTRIRQGPSSPCGMAAVSLGFFYSCPTRNFFWPDGGVG